MKRLLYPLLMLGLASPLPAADEGAPRKDGGAMVKAEAQLKADKDRAAKGASEGDKTLAGSLSFDQKTKLLWILNTGNDQELGTLPGIGDVRVTAIKAARPFKVPTDLLNVAGIGSGTFKNIIAYAKAGFVIPAPKAKGPRKKLLDESQKAKG